MLLILHLKISWDQFIFSITRYKIVSNDIAQEGGAIASFNQDSKASNVY